MQGFVKLTTRGLHSSKHYIWSHKYYHRSYPWWQEPPWLPLVLWCFTLSPYQQIPPLQTTCHRWRRL